ncbi:CheR family methyltransferase [Algoriphagus sp.]|uniref:CheR family methyltransferase n=1 Tax=Algoriphagus sp. TaxID=1872435 RepID=UPI00391B45F3
MNYNFPIIGIGASAGGLEPLELFFEYAKLPSDFSYVLIQHLAPNHKSLMDELLARHTRLPILIIEHDMILEKGKIYLNPPKKFVELQEGRFILSEKEDRKLSFPISTFLNSLAEQAHEKACAIILSGTGSDGSEGIKFIKEKGGLVLAQSPDTAKFDGMPKSAILTGAVDKVCSVQEMHQELDSYFTYNLGLIGVKLESKDSKSLIAAILQTVYKKLGVDFTEYKYTTVSRRIARRMSLLGFPEMEEYLQYLRETNSEATLLSKELLIGVTRFFRDEESFYYLKSQVIPQLIENNQETKSIRVWVPACSTGEEAYTLAILIKDHLRINKLQYEVSIFATDLDKDAIKQAANRIFPESISSEIPPEYLNMYFIPQRKGFTISKEIREMIIFSAHNVVQDPPFNKIDLISCRNFLIYLNNELQQRLFMLFQYSLKTGGFLFLGSSESLGDAIDNFIEVDKKHKVFVNRENKKVVQQLRNSSRRALSPTELVDNSIVTAVQSSTPSNKNKLLAEIQNTLIQEYVPDSMVTDENFNLLHTTGNAHRWLTLPAGEISMNVLKMLPESLALPFEVVASKVLATGDPIRINHVEITGSLKNFYNADKQLRILVRKTELVEGLKQLIATFEQEESAGGLSPSEEIDISFASKEKINILERELRINRENLQSTIEELESSNEELQAANEELQSSNEELESVNEELYTVNAEFQQKIVELSESNNDLNNLIQSTEIALLFLDTNLNIRRFTPAIKKILDLLPHDIGRNISHFRGKIQLDNFMEHIETVFENLVPFETQITDSRDGEYILKISPFKTQKNEIQGVVLVFIDMIKASRMERALEISDNALEALHTKHDKQSALFELIANNSRDMISIIDMEGKMQYCSPSGVEITGFPEERLVGMNLTDRLPDPIHKKRWLKAIEEIKNGQTPNLIQFKFKTWNGTHRWMESNLKPLNLSGKSVNILVTTRDIHQRMLRDVELQKLALIAEQTSNAVIITDSNGKITFVNEAFEKMTGYTEEEVLGKKPGHILQGKESSNEMINKMSIAIRNQTSIEVELINYTKSGNKYMVRIQMEPMFDKNQELIGFFSIQNDITNQKDQEGQIHRLNQKIKSQNQKLEEVNKSLEEFAYVASHDLKAPIRNISGLLELIQKKGEKLDPEKRANYFEVIRSSSQELGRLIDNLLEYSRSGKLQEELETVKLEPIFKSVVQQFDLEINKLKGKITLDLDVEEIQVYPILFKRLLTNLISNSIKYRSDKPVEIKISAKSYDDWIEFRIIDNGIGIPAQHLDEIFKIFKTLGNSTDSNGIGLSVCKKIVEHHGGKIWVESQPGLGSTFIFQITL